MAAGLRIKTEKILKATNEVESLKRLTYMEAFDACSEYVGNFGKIIEA